MSDTPPQPPAQPDPQQPVYAQPPAAPAQPSGYAQPPGQYPGAPAPGAATNVLSVVSLIASIVGLVGILPILGSITGVVTGHIGAKQIRERGEQGAGMAKAGLIIGYIGLGLWIIGGILFLAIFVVAIAASEPTYTYD